MGHTFGRMMGRTPSLAIPVVVVLLIGCPKPPADSGGGEAGTDSATTDSAVATDSGTPNGNCVNVRSDPGVPVGLAAICGFDDTMAFAITSFSGELVALPDLQRFDLPFPKGSFGPDPRDIGCGPDGLVWVTLGFGVDQLVGIDVSSPGAMSVGSTIQLAAGASPRGIAFATGLPGQTLAYVANSGDDTVSVVDIEAKTVVQVFTVSAPVPGGNATPVDLLIDVDILFVANIALDAGAMPGTGFVAVLERTSGTELNTIPATQASPSSLSLDPTGANLLVANVGRVDPFGVPNPFLVEAGGLDVIDLATAGAAAAPTLNLPLTLGPGLEPVLGGLGPAAGLDQGNGDGDVFGGSSLTGDLFRFDLNGALVTRDSDNPIGVFPGSSGATGAHVVNGELAVTDFSSDTVCFTDDPTSL